jgi:hypothetical protein
MCEFGPARRLREAQVAAALLLPGTASSSRRVSGTNGLGYFCRNRSDSRAQRTKALDLFFDVLKK